MDSSSWQRVAVLATGLTVAAGGGAYLAARAVVTDAARFAEDAADVLAEQRRLEGRLGTLRVCMGTVGALAGAQEPGRGVATALSEALDARAALQRLKRVEAGPARAPLWRSAQEVVLARAIAGIYSSVWCGCAIRAALTVSVARRMRDAVRRSRHSVAAAQTLRRARREGDGSVVGSFLGAVGGVVGETAQVLGRGFGFWGVEGPKVWEGVEEEAGDGWDGGAILAPESAVEAAEAVRRQAVFATRGLAQRCREAVSVALREGSGWGWLPAQGADVEADDVGAKVTLRQWDALIGRVRGKLEGGGEFEFPTPFGALAPAPEASERRYSHLKLGLKSETAQVLDQAFDLLEHPSMVRAMHKALDVAFVRFRAQIAASTFPFEDAPVLLVDVKKDELYGEEEEEEEDKGEVEEETFRRRVAPWRVPADRLARAGAGPLRDGNGVATSDPGASVGQVLANLASRADPVQQSFRPLGGSRPLAGPALGTFPAYMVGAAARSTAVSEAMWIAMAQMSGCPRDRNVEKRADQAARRYGRDIDGALSFYQTQTLPVSSQAPPSPSVLADSALRGILPTETGSFGIGVAPSAAFAAAEGALAAFASAFSPQRHTMSTSPTTPRYEADRLIRQAVQESQHGTVTPGH